MSASDPTDAVIPAKAGIQSRLLRAATLDPAFAGMTERVSRAVNLTLHHP